MFIRNIMARELIVRKSIDAISKVFNTATLPVYFAYQRPWKKQDLSNEVKAVCTDPVRMIYENKITPKCRLHQEIEENNLDTLEKLFSYSIKKYKNRPCLGSRDVISEETVSNMEGKHLRTMQVYELGQYNWKTYEEVGEQVENLVQSFTKIGLSAKDKIGIFADTRSEWLMTAMAAFRKNLTIVTIFPALNDTGILLAIQETNIEYLFVSDNLLTRCETILQSEKALKIRDLIIMNPANGAPVDTSNIPVEVEVYNFTDLLQPDFTPEVVHDVREDANRRKPTRDDAALIMYTSGSSGTPKGVILSHYNLVSTLAYQADILSEYTQTQEGDTYIAYLPLAHVMELVCEAMCLLEGVHIGYSTPNTFFASSPGLKEGCASDAELLRPTIVLTVPLVLEKVCKSIRAKFAEKGSFTEIVINGIVEYKKLWLEKGYSTPLVDKLFFGKVKELLGGRVRFIATGGSSLSEETQSFCRAVFACPIIVGYGMTESTATATIAKVSDLSMGRCGAPLGCTKIRLENWPDGGYKVTDKPFPRGEIIIGGDNVAIGYFNRPHNKDFFEEDGIQWIRSGDIAEVHPDGAFKIIDRKKDLVKISTGEHISLGRIESTLKSTALVENICICSIPSKAYTVCLLVPSQKYVEALARQRKIKFKSFKYLIKDQEMLDLISQDLESKAKDLGLNVYEIPRAFQICSPWTPSSGLVTASLKIRRKNIYEYYRADIRRMFDEFDTVHFH